MLRKLLAAAVVAVALTGMLSACAGQVPQGVKDKLVCDDSERLCAYMAAAVVFQLAEDRVVNREPQDAIPTMGRLLVVLKALGRVDGAGGDWRATESFKAGRALVLALEPIVKGRAGSVLAGALTPTPGFVLAELYRGGLAAAVHKDIRAMVAEKPEMEVIATIQARLAGILARIKAVGDVA